MPDTHTLEPAARLLRQQAEAKVPADATAAFEGLTDLSPSDMRRLIHELRVHQIELEIQNDELRRTQADLDTAQARYFDFYDLAPVGYLTVSEQGLIVHANRTTATLLGVTRNLLVGHAITRFIHWADQDAYYLLRQRLARSESAQSCELRLCKPSGEPFFARMDAVLARGDDAAPVLRLVLIDTSEKNRVVAAAAKAAAEHDKFMQAILDSVSAEVVVLDRHGVITAVNEPWQRFAQCNSVTPGTQAPYTGVGSNYLAACRAQADDSPDNTALAAHDGIQAVLSGALPSFNLEYACHSREQRRWFSMRALPLSTDPKDGLTITHADMTAIRQAEESLRIAAVAFETQEAIIVLDGQRRFMRANQAFMDICGYRQQELLGQPISILYSTRHTPDFYASIWQATDSEGRERGGRWIQHKNGQDIYAQGTTTAVKNQQGQTTHYVITFSDQTLAHQQDQLRANQEAAHRVALVREVHHRIKNNLQGIGGLLTQFASQKPEIAEQMRLVSGHFNGISVIHGLQGRHEKSRVRLCELTREIAQATSAIWQTAIAIDIPAAWRWRLVAEKEAVSMALVLNEVLVNAVKHGGKAQGRVQITLRQGAGIEGVELRVLNAGTLPSPEQRQQARHHGLQLIESLRPPVGLNMTMEQCGDYVHTLLQITAPVLTLDPDH